MPALDDVEAWIEAGAYIAAHGEAWPDEALSYLKTLSIAEDRDRFQRWIDLMEKMSELTLSKRQ
jgi:hypothetical protein